MRKFVTITSLLAIASLTACSEPVSEASDVAAPVIAEKPDEEVRDLGGLVVTIAQWSNEGEPEEKRSSYEQALWDYRNEMAQKHNFQLERVAMTTWKDGIELLSSSSMAGEPAAEVFRIDASFVSALLNTSLATDLSTLDSIDLTNSKWNKVTTNLMTNNGFVYGTVPDFFPSHTLYFNKRLFEEAGIDPELLYDLQAKDEWTWEAFEEISAQLTRDTNNDGLTDVYALSMQPYDLFHIAILSNNGSLVAQDENGLYYNNTSSPETLQALEWVADYIKQGYEILPQDWKSIPNLFMTGQAAMFIGQVWNARIFAEEMADDYGMVCFPKGPKGELTVAVGNQQGWVIPSAYTKEEAEDIAFVLDIWANTPPGYDPATAWMSEHYPIYRDDRAVEETHVIARQPGTAKAGYEKVISNNVKITQLYTQIYNGGMTPAESAQQVAKVWQAELDKVNNK